MKLRNKLAAITAATMLAFTGVGFAAWTFTQERQASTDAADRVSVGIELNNNFKLYNADNNHELAHLFLICDAPSGKNFVLNGSGIYWAEDEAGAVSVDDVYLKGTLDKAEEDNILDKATVTVQFTATHDLSSSYVTFGALSAPANLNVNVADDAEVKSADFNLPTVSYVEANIPQDNAALTAMNTALGTDLSGKALSFSAQIIA